MPSTNGKHIDLTPLSFRDADHLAEWTSELGWDHSVTQLTPGPDEIRYDHFGFPDLSVAHYTARQSNDSIFGLPDGMVLFLICREKLPLIWNGRQIPPTLLAVARSGREHNVVLPGGWDSYEFMLTEDLVRQTELFPPSFFAATSQPERALVRLIEPVTGQFLRGIGSFFRQARGAQGPNGFGVDRARFFDFIIGGLQELIDTGLRASDVNIQRNARRFDLVKNARDLVAAHLETGLSVDEVARALEVSYRTLNYAFKESLGISPYRYVLTQRLHAVRRQLKSSDVSVTEACMTYGFNTPSRFARQYARLFGELPSVTRNGNGQHREMAPAGR